MAISDPQTLNYELGNNEYAIVILVEEGAREEEVKQLALKKAAEKARSESFRYLTIEKEGPVGAILSGKDSDSSNTPSNMYYDLRQSDNFGRERYSDEQMAQGKPQSAYQIIFKCYTDKPGGQAVDVCDVIPCTH